MVMDRIREANSIALEPDIRGYSCYRKYLSDFFAFKKSGKASFSYRRFASLVGVKSPNYLQLVMQGKRNLSEDVGEAVARVAGLKDAEKAYFLTLVRKEVARSEVEKRRVERDMSAVVKRLVTRGILRSQADVLTKWYHLLVRELVLLPDFEATGAYVSKKLSGLISEEQAEESLRLLLKNGFIRASVPGKFEQSDPVLDTGDHAFQRSLMDAHHSETLKTWSQNLARLSPAEQERGLLNIPIRDEMLPELQARIRQFQEELIGWLQSVENPTRVVQLGIYMMPFGK